VEKCGKMRANSFPLAAAYNGFCEGGLRAAACSLSILSVKYISETFAIIFALVATASASLCRFNYEMWLNSEALPSLFFCPWYVCCWHPCT